VRFTVRRLATALALVLLAAPLAAEAQQPAKIPRICWVGAGSPATGGHQVHAFLQGLRELGYLDGQNVAIEYRWANGKLERLPALVADMVRLRVDVIVSSATAAIRAAKEQTSTIPIIMAGVTDPVGVGLVASLSRPGGNITGLTHLSPELTAKRLQLLKEVVARLSRVAVLWDPNHPGAQGAFNEARVAAQALHVTLISMQAQNLEELNAVLLSIGKDRPQALFALADTFTFFHRGLITEVAARHKLPGMFHMREFADAGGLMSYGANFADLARHAAVYVGKILKGAKPADLPVEQPTKFELVINLKTAKALGLTIPASVLAQADHVIE
jgi:putative ABC transport system substrate-binding protein